MILAKEYTSDKEIDIIYYFNNLHDICASLLLYDEKQVLKTIKDIYETDKHKKQLLITNFFFPSLTSQPVLKYKLEDLSSTSKSLKKCKKQVKGCSGALYKKFKTKQQAQKYIDEQKIKGDDLLNIWTDSYFKKNGKTDAIASIE
ncbi:11869_t:CDS:2, partial [Dentiscutata heterogama]